MKRHAIKHKLNHEITKDAKIDFRYIKTDHARISKRAIEEKNYLGTESWENDKEVSKNRSIVHKSEVADTKKAKNPLTQANY